MSNWRELLTRARGWLKPDGRMFLHVFSHRTTPYRFDKNDPADWIAHHFFTGGVMPSHDLIRQFGDLFAVEADWRWSGEHYQKTATTGWPTTTATPPRSWPPSGRSTAPTPSCGTGAGVSSSSPPPASSVTTGEPNGPSATIASSGIRMMRTGNGG